MSSLRIALYGLLLVLAGCAATPPQPIAEATWQRVDSEIVTASRRAAGEAREQALAAMDRWMDLVYRQTDEAFIPWYSSYWTQRWLSLKVSWYKLGADGARDPTVERLALYLQDQYRERVLEPVAEQTEPTQILQQSTRFYLHRLGQRLPAIAQRHGVPAAQFERHLQAIPAIVQPPGASLYQLLRAEQPERLPAYAALLERIASTPGRGGDWSTHPGISLVARRTSERLVDDLTTSGAASAASAMVGGVAGVAISLSATVLRAMLHENARAASEAQLRQSLYAAFDEEWLELVRSPERGVMAGIHQLSTQIEGQLLRYRPRQADGQPLWIEP